MQHITLKERKRNTWTRAKTRVTYARERATRVKWQYAGQQVECTNTELKIMVAEERTGKTTNEKVG